MLAHIMEPNLGLQNYVASRGRADAFFFRGTKVTPELTAHLWFARNEYIFSLQPAADGSVFFAKEEAPFNGQYGETRYSQGSGHKESPLAKNLTGWAGERFAAATLRDWRLYHFHDTSAQAAVMRVQNVADNERLRGDAGNLAPFLLKLRESHRNVYDFIVSEIRNVAPFFGDFVLDPLDSEGLQTQLRWRERYSDLVYYPNQFSDGTLRFICLATLLLQPMPPSTLIIDEPELGLHPFAIAMVSALFKLASDRCQLIVSTQSAPLVDSLDVEDLIVVNREEGESTLQRLEKARLQHWLEEYSLGDLVKKNVIEAGPANA